MPQWLGLLWLLLFFFVIGWAVSALLTPPAVERLAGISEPRKARRRLWMIALTPLFFPAVAVAALLFQALAKQLGWMLDHCHLHGSGHPHFCFAHLPELTWSLFHPLFAGTALGLLVVPVGFRLWRENQQQRRVGALEQMASRRGALRVFEGEEATAFAAGLRHPRIFLSRKLLSDLSPRERRIVLTHEVAHIRHRDMLGQLLFDCLLVLQRPASAAALRGRWEQIQEQMADDRAVARFGALDVAATLVKLARQARERAPVATAVLGDQPAARIKRILNPPTDDSRGPIFEVAYAMAAMALAALTQTSHHSLETLLGYLPGA